MVLKQIIEFYKAIRVIWYASFYDPYNVVTEDGLETIQESVLCYLTTVGWAYYFCGLSVA